MNQILDRSILLIYCLGSVFFTNIDTALLIAFLSASIHTCLHYYAGQRSFHLFLSLFYLALMPLNPGFILFFPAVLYGILEDKYRTILVPCGLLCLFRLTEAALKTQFFLITGILLSLLLSRRAHSYQNLVQKFKQMRDDSVELNLLLKEKNQVLLEKQDYEIYTATLKERNRIAREIHDNVGHMLSRSILLTGAIRTVNKDTALTLSLEQLETTLSSAMTSVRESVHDLHNDSIHLKEALTSLIEAFTFCPVSFEYDMGFEAPKAVKYCLIAIVKEALNNVMRHSNAKKVHITLREHPALYQLIIEDNGTLQPTYAEDGLGLLNMKERIATLNGQIQIQTENGFRIFITIPKREDF